MAGTKGRRLGGQSVCKVCAHPGVDEINVMLLNGVDYTIIITKMKQGHPTAEELTKSNLSRHKRNHLLNKPITIEGEDGKHTYITGAFLAERITVDRSAIPDPVAIPDALRVIIAAGVANVLQNPSLVTPQILVPALDLARKMGLFSGDSQDFADAWAALAGAKAKKERKRTRRVTVEETVEESSQDGDEPDVIDVPPEKPRELPDLWGTEAEWPASAEAIPVRRKEIAND